MLARLDLRGHKGPFDAMLPAPVEAGSDVREAVAAILAEVREGGDAALGRLTKQFDGVSVDELRVPTDTIARALERVPAVLRSALELAEDRIRAYHATEGSPPPDF